MTFRTPIYPLPPKMPERDPAEQRLERYISQADEVYDQGGYGDTQLFAWKSSDGEWVWASSAFIGEDSKLLGFDPDIAIWVAREYTRRKNSYAELKYLYAPKIQKERDKAREKAKLKAIRDRANRSARQQLIPGAGS